jgi:glutamate--cysteine ligase
MCVRTDDEQWKVPKALTFRQWITTPGDHPPSLDDLDYHLSTLFPPVRARGYLELRMVDAQPDDGWRVPLAVICALLDDPLASDAALAATEELNATEINPWLTAAREGLSTPLMARVAGDCFAAASAALDRLAAPNDLRIAVADFQERYVERGRCPADELGVPLERSQ